MKKVFFVLFIAFASHLIAADGEAVYKAKCFSCHGVKASKPALNKSKVIAGWRAEDIIASINGYKNDQGGAMKNVMKPIATGLSEDDLKAVATTIATYK